MRAVGRGGNASIVAGVDPSGSHVAIKVLHPELAVSVAADRFLREIRYVAQLDHRHLARLLASGETDYLLWYVMPYVAGDTLREVLRRERRLSIPPRARPSSWRCSNIIPPHNCAPCAATCRTRSRPWWREPSPRRESSAGRRRPKCAPRSSPSSTPPERRPLTPGLVHRGSASPAGRRLGHPLHRRPAPPAAEPPPPPPPPPPLPTPPPA